MRFTIFFAVIFLQALSFGNHSINAKSASVIDTLPQKWIKGSRSSYYFVEKRWTLKNGSKIEFDFFHLFDFDSSGNFFVWHVSNSDSIFVSKKSRSGRYTIYKNRIIMEWREPLPFGNIRDSTKFPIKIQVFKIKRKKLVQISHKVFKTVSEASKTKFWKKDRNYLEKDDFQGTLRKIVKWDFNG